MHRMLEAKLQGQSLLDEQDKNIISKIETYVINLNSKINPEHLKKIVDIDRMAYARSSLEKQLRNLQNRFTIIEEIAQKAKTQKHHIQKLLKSEPFKKFEMLDRERTLSDILQIPEDSNVETLTNGLQRFLEDSNKRFENIRDELKEVCATGNQEYASADPVVVDYINYKEDNKFRFELGKNGRLLKISRSETGPRFSVIYFNSAEKNSKGGYITQHKMVLYSGKDRALGFGKFGKVKLLQDYVSDMWYAAKVQNTEDNKFYPIEVENLKKVNMYLYDIELSSRKKHYIAMELAEGDDAFTLINESIGQHINNDLDIVGILLAAAKALQKLHNTNMIHRDVKLENFVFNKENKECKLIDYQFLVSIDDSGKFSNKILVGTPGFLAQELEEAIKNKPNEFIYTKRSDIYAFGMILNNLADHLNTTIFKNFIGSQGLEFTKRLELRPDKLELFIGETEQKIASYSSSINSPQPRLLHGFSRQPHPAQEDLPESKKLNMQEQESYFPPQRFRAYG